MIRIVLAIIALALGSAGYASQFPTFDSYSGSGWEDVAPSVHFVSLNPIYVPIRAGAVLIFNHRMTVVEPQNSYSFSADPAYTFKIDDLANRAWTSKTTTELGGRIVHVFPTVDREKNAFLAAYAEGTSGPAYQSIISLTDEDQLMVLGGQTYRVGFRKNPNKALKKVIEWVVTFQNIRDSNDFNRNQIMVRSLKDGLLGQMKDGQWQPGAAEVIQFHNTEVFLFLNREFGKETIFLLSDPDRRVEGYFIPMEAMREDKPVAFRVFGGDMIGFKKSASAIEIYTK